jgi:hypothetical protein
MFMAAVSQPMDYDTAFFASVAKNVANGFGYITSHHEKLFFNPEVTTGPTLILPLAGLIYFLSNTFWLPSLFMVTVNLLLLGLLSINILRLPAVKNQAPLCLLALYMFFFFYEAVWWVMFMADVAILLCLANAAFYIADRGIADHSIERGTAGGRVMPWKAGCLLALAVPAKMSCVMALPALLVAAGIKYRHEGHLLKGLAVLFLPLVLVMAGLHVYKQQEWRRLEVEGVKRDDVRAMDFLLQHKIIGIGRLVSADDSITYVKKAVRRGNGVMKNLFQRYGLPQAFVYILLLAPVLWALASLTWVWTRGVSVATLFAWLASTFTVWFMAISMSLVPKYSFTAVSLSVIFWLLILMRNRFLSAAVVCLFFVWVALIPAPMLASTRFFYTLDAEKTVQNRATDEVADWMQRANPVADGAEWAYCGWLSASRAVFYRLPGLPVLTDCYLRVYEQVQFEQDGTAHWRKPLSLWVLRHKYNMAFDHHNRQRWPVIEQLCDRTLLFENSFYEVRRCPWASWQALEQQPDVLRGLAVDPSEMH